MKYVSLRPSLSDNDAQKKRPTMLNSDSNPANPAAMPAIAVFWLASNCAKPSSGLPSKAPPKISCNIGDAMPITPMPADTLRHSTAPISQNCGVLCASLRCTLPDVIMPPLD